MRMRYAALLLSLSVAVPALAADDGPRGTLSKINGVVRVAKPGGTIEAAAASGQPLFTGDKVLTAAGKAEIRFNDGNTIRLAANASIEIMGPEHPKKPGIRGIFTRLLQGSVRVLVKNLEKDEAFEIHGLSAIASVKGTDLIFDGETASVRDEGDAVEHAVEVLDPNNEKSVLRVMEGFTGGFGPGGRIEPRAIDPDKFAQLEREFEIQDAANAAPPAGGAPEAGGGTPPNGESAGSGEGNAEENEDSDLRDELMDFKESGDLADLTDGLERQGDLTLGRSLIDRHGFRVETEEHVSLVESNRIQFLVLNRRDGGPHAGESVFQSDVWFNQDLSPDHYEDDRRAALASLRDPGQAPTLWMTREEERVSNPGHDFVLTRILLSDPLPVYNHTAGNLSGGTWNYQDDDFFDSYTPEQTGWAQPFEWSRYVGFADGPLVPKEHFLVTAYGDLNAGWYAGAAPIDPGTIGAVDEYNFSLNPGGAWSGPAFVTGNDPDAPAMWPVIMAFAGSFAPENWIGNPTFNNPVFGSGSVYAWINGAGGLSVKTEYGDGTFIRESMFIVGEAGNVLRFDAALSDSELTAGEAGTNNFEYEVDFDDTDGVIHGIDILIDPSIFEDGQPGGTDQNGDGNQAPQCACCMC